MAEQFLTGGRQTTINSTITELFPALAFNNKKLITLFDRIETNIDHSVDLYKN